MQPHSGRMEIKMSKSNKETTGKIALRLLAMILAGLMVVSIATLLITFLIK